MSFYIDRDKLSALLKDFYVLTGLRIAVFDDSFNELACYPNQHCRFCRTLRQSEQAREKCAVCDKEACLRCRKERKRITYRCHAGLIESVSPICHESTVIGYVMVGQTLPSEDKGRSWNEHAQYLEQFGLPMEELESAYMHVKVLSKETIEAATHIMEACSGFLYLSRMIVLRDDSIAGQLERFIVDNLDSDLSVDNLCHTFGISKTKLYEIAATSYGRGIAEHVRTLRLDKACILLSETDKRISRVATLCGFDDYNYFTKVFKLHYGLPPREFRKSKAKKNRE